MIIGTSHFVSKAHAIRYYLAYESGCYTECHQSATAAVAQKLAEGEIHIGEPALKPGQKLLVIDNGARYAIEETEQTKTNQEIYNEQRARYLAHEVTHQDYYLWLCDFIGLNNRVLASRKDAILASKDEHFNDVPLKWWDNLDLVVRPMANRKHIAWSLSDTVCCTKALAQKMREES